MKRQLRELVHGPDLSGPMKRQLRELVHGPDLSGR
jgi:hypothetical protein